MMYVIYEIKNNVNNHNYIGQHRCTDINDNYMGSGTLLRCAKRKYGINSFSKNILAVCYSKTVCNILEKQYIELYRSIGKAEYNIANGGDGGNGDSNKGKPKSEECKEKLRIANLGKKQSVETINKRRKKLIGQKRVFSEQARHNMSLAHIGKKPSLKSIQAQIKAQTGRVLSEEWKRKISESNKGKHHNVNLSDEQRKKRSESIKGEKNPFYGKHHSLESRKKISDGQRGERNHNYGKHFSEEHRRKISEALKCKPKSNEHRRKISEARMGEKNYNYGKHFSEEHRRKIGESRKNKSYVRKEI